MKKKINFIGFWQGFNKTDNFIYNILKERYELEISDNPDYLFCSPLCKPFEYLKWDCARIFWTGEPLSPNFIHMDYFIGFDYVDYLDRTYRYPLCFLNHVGAIRKSLTRSEAEEILKNKKYFCNYIYSHQTNNNVREKLFELLSKYKRVESFGKFKNNQPDNKAVSWGDEKFEVLKLSKFTIAVESMVYPGFLTEKITDAFSNYSIPIYFGDKYISKDFNTKSFINVCDYNSLDEVVDRIIEIDNDDELYIQMLMESPTNNPNITQELYDNFKLFLFNILDQSPKDAIRRGIEYQGAVQESFAKEYSRFHGTFWYKLLRKLKIIK